jgi:hypothetical protein
MDLIRCVEKRPVSAFFFQWNRCALGFRPLAQPLSFKLIAWRIVLTAAKHCH